MFLVVTSTPLEELFRVVSTSIDTAQPSEDEKEDETKQIRLQRK